MMKPNLRTVSTEATPPRSRQRAALSEAIRASTAAAEHIARLKAALKRTEDLLYGAIGAIDAVDKAKAMLAEAKLNEGAHLAAVAIGEAEADANPAEAAAVVVAEADARLDATRKTKAALEEQLTAAEKQLPYVKTALDRCVAAVLRDETAAVIATTLRDAVVLQEQLGLKRVILAFFESACFSWDEREQAKPIANFLAAPAYPIERAGQRHEHPAADKWRASAKALETDADAALPT